MCRRKTMNKNLEFYKLSGKRAHIIEEIDRNGYLGYRCEECDLEWDWKDVGCKWDVPNYKDDPRMVLAVMRARNDWLIFLRDLEVRDIIGLVMDKTGKLRDLAIKWMKE
jgi:hypothetical protein